MKKTARRAFITRRLAFSAAHRLQSDELSAAENRRVFGKCNYPNGHGHNYVLEVTIAGPIDATTGMVFNLTDLKEVMTEVVDRDFDHKNLNMDVSEFRTLNPTAENIAAVLWDRLQKRLKPGLLHEVRLIETENNFVSYRG
ncbi:MAG TPA: 6-carboxytetrahydropterin synthase [Elusimicrobiota bacterium]|nr:6-carboxytetrahydropterin synthase [Elusimicrobiota bacterium]